MRKGCEWGWTQFALILVVAVLAGQDQAAAGIAAPAAVIGPQRMLIVAVRFPGTVPAFSLSQLKEKVGKVDGYLRAASYGKTWLEPKLVGWYEMPAPLSQYQVSPLNYKVDRGRVRRLLADALAAARKDAAIEEYHVVWIVVGARTRPGEGYGMIAYCANPGMLSGVRSHRAALETVELPGGLAFSGPAIVSAENAHVGHVVHDLLHALGGARDGRRVVPDLYDFDMQSDPEVFRNPPGGRLLPRIFAVHAGPWDIMSQHFIEFPKAPPAPSTFTRLQLGWIDPDQVVTVRPGETRELVLQPLALGKGQLVVRIPLDSNRYLLLENRQGVGGDTVLPSAGLLVLEVDTAREEGHGIVRAVNANPGIPYLYAAPFVPGAGERRYHRDPLIGVAVAPLAIEPGGALRLIVTTPERTADYVPGDRR
jgi:M6 family metalloprotease-like protein